MLNTCTSCHSTSYLDQVIHYAQEWKSTAFSIAEIACFVTGIVAIEKQSKEVSLISFCLLGGFVLADKLLNRPYLSNRSLRRHTTPTDPAHLGEGLPPSDDDSGSSSVVSISSLSSRHLKNEVEETASDLHRSNSTISSTSINYFHKHNAEQIMRQSLYEALHSPQVDSHGFTIDLHAELSTQVLIDQDVKDPFGVANIRVASRGRHLIQASHSHKLTIICDGSDAHGAIANVILDFLPKELEEKVTALDEKTIGNTLTNFIVGYDKNVKECSQPNSLGVMRLTGSLIFDQVIYIFNVGLRTILCRANEVFQLTKEEDRAIGSESLSPHPEITRILRGEGTDHFEPENTTLYCPSGSFLVQASEEFWKVASNQEVLKVIQQMETAQLSPQEMAAHLVNGALQNASNDAITVIVIKLE